MKDLLQKSYDKTAPYYEERFREIQYIKYNEIFTHLVLLDTHKILDVGCGTGLLKRYLNEHFINCDYTGTDYSEGMLTIASKYGGVYVCNDFTLGFPFKREYYDFIFMITVLKIIDYNESDIVARIMSCLKSDGVCVLTILAYKFTQSFRKIIEEHSVLDKIFKCGQDIGLILRKK